MSNNSTLALSPRCSPSTRALSTPLRNCRLMNRSSVGELTHQDSVTDPTNWTYSSSSAFLPSDSTVMNQYSESEGEIKRPGRIQRLQKSRLQSRPTSRETAFIPKRRIPGLCLTSSTAPRTKLCRSPELQNLPSSAIGGNLKIPPFAQGRACCQGNACRHDD